jgi:hypothetical protein
MELFPENTGKCSDPFLATRGNGTFPRPSLSVSIISETDQGVYPPGILLIIRSVREHGMAIKGNPDHLLVDKFVDLLVIYVW